jgi:hypothetical protein
MKIGIAILLSAIAAALIVAGVLSLNSGNPSVFLGVLPAALLISVPYVAIVGCVFYAVLRKKKKGPFWAYAIAGGVAGACYLLVPMILSGEVGSPTNNFVNFVPFGLTLISSGSVAGIVFRLCIDIYEKKTKTA